MPWRSLAASEDRAAGLTKELLLETTGHAADALEGVEAVEVFGLTRRTSPTGEDPGGGALALQT